MRGLYCDEREPWYEPFRSELLSFPAGKHDDQVDSTTMALRHLRDNNFALRSPEYTFDAELELQYRPRLQPLYPC